MPDESFAADMGQPRRRRVRLSQLVAVAIVAVMLLFVLAVAVAIIWQRDPTPPPTLADLAAAEMRWQSQGPASYDLDLVTSRNDQMHLEVRDGKPRAFTVNGHQPKERRVWETWTVPRQFEYIRDDMAREVPPGSAAPLIQVQFDAKTGLPWNHSYSGANGVTTGWKINRFESIPAREAAR
ncbi:MAG: DUF6174 domain-containing protein [Planctomycetes bacterium]|nr:DUF6174 domain-containing protein [Planctomycetota bacterium]